ncbi:capsular polysaccharide biosynthesis protein [Marinobacterium nitratireducens]|uniref:Capsular polysaccharide biosynthesis protein n=1 Tax=Marinobacterium nitratireducens TaxID=518897 RepID=A0A918DRI9_9GAMM|nr:LTA synthase family protein [Marinobacterium nitratireducens]GGO79486.1 capsular polysaccharide biosynthesis protein [Marinobacterium nitratireducens]
MTLTDVILLITSLLLSFNLGRFCNPRHSAFAAPGLHLLIMAALFLVAYALTRRFCFSLLIALCAQLVVLIVNNAKYRFLREPLVHADFALYSQAIRFPRLYLPFVGIGPALIGTLAISATLTGGLLLEAPSALLWSTALTDRLLALAGLAVLIPLIIAPARRREVSLIPESDMQRYGLLPMLAIYAAQSRIEPVASQPPLPVADGRPNLIAIQSESFFDARRLDSRIRPSILGCFDRLKREAAASGRLRVPAWGAYTMRSEFAFLSGRANASLGFGRFDPLRFYRNRLAEGGIDSLAAQLRRQGYRCICIHPYPVKFFARHRIYPQLGFDEFIDIRSFREARRFGPYVSDEAVCDRILEELSTSDQPLFIFAITMENHGPLHLESVTAAERATFFSTETDASDDNLAIYLRHLRNADRMLERLSDYLAERDPQAVLAWYGDHVPGMPDIYQARDYDDPTTDYLVWSAGADIDERTGPQEASVEDLPGMMLRATQRQKELCV